VNSIPASHHDLLDARFATLATLGPDGHPQLSVIWFLAEDDTVRISLNTSRQKTKNLRADPACTLLIVDPATAFRYLEIRADADIAPDDDYVFADRVGAKYNSDLRVHDGPGDSRIVITLRPTKVNAVDMRQ
jgi:PPOX class probable F420-dependent enzyme